MLSSIHPLGERARHNIWWVTVTAFTVAAVGSGALIGAVLGAVGGMIFESLEPAVLLGSTAGLALVAGLLDLGSTKPWGPDRQVNEHWIGHYRSWVYGGAFGAQLGLGFATYVVTWGVYATLAGQLLTVSASAGALVGAVFGLGRSFGLIVAVRIDRPSRLITFHSRMATLGPVWRSWSALLLVGMAVVAGVGVMI